MFKLPFYATLDPNTPSTKKGGVRPGERVLVIGNTDDGREKLYIVCSDNRIRIAELNDVVFDGYPERSDEKAIAHIEHIAELLKETIEIGARPAKPAAAKQPEPKGDTGSIAGGEAESSAAEPKPQPKRRGI